MIDSIPIIVLGAGGHARVLLDILTHRAPRILGIADREPPAERRLLGVPVIGDDAWVLRYAPGDVLLVNGLGCTTSTLPRQQLFIRFAALKYRFATVVHPSAILARDAVLGEGAQVMAGAILQTGTAVGENSIINTRASIDHDCIIGSHAHIAPGVVLCGGVRVGDAAVVGAGVVVIQGVTIGPRAVVAAGAAVVRDLDPDSRVAGVPAKRMTSCLQDRSH